MIIKPLKPDLTNYLKKHGLAQKFKKQIKLFYSNFRHPSLHTEILEPKKLRLYSFRINQKYRAIFIQTKEKEVEIVDINDHYQ